MVYHSLVHAAHEGVVPVVLHAPPVAQVGGEAPLCGAVGCQVGAQVPLAHLAITGHITGHWPAAANASVLTVAVSSTVWCTWCSQAVSVLYSTWWVVKPSCQCPVQYMVGGVAELSVCCAVHGVW